MKVTIAKKRTHVRGVETRQRDEARKAVLIEAYESERPKRELGRGGGLVRPPAARLWFGTDFH